MNWTRLNLALMILLSPVWISSCARFRINDLTTTRRLSLPISDDAFNARPGQILVEVREGALYNLPSVPAIYGSRILLPLPARNVVVEFGEDDSTPERIYVPENAKPAAHYERVKTVRLPAGQIGLAVPAEKGATIFQIYGTPEKKKKPEGDDPENRLPTVLVPEILTQSPSDIYVQTTPEDRPRKLDADTHGGTRFRGVQRIVPTEKGLLFIVHTPEGARPVVNIYRDFRLEATLTVPDSLFVAKDASVEMDAIFPFQGRAEAMASLVIRKKNNFEPIKRILYVLRPGAEPREIFATDSKENLPVWTREDGGFLLGRDEDGTGVLFQVYSKEGDYMNNNRLRYEGLRESWPATFFNGEDRLFSVRLNRGTYEILEWK